MAGQLVLMGCSFPRVAALRYGSASQFISALNRLDNTGNNTRQILLKISGAACNPLPETQKSVPPHANLSGFFGWLWRRTGLRHCSGFV